MSRLGRALAALVPLATAVVVVGCGLPGSATPAAAGSDARPIVRHSMMPTAESAISLSLVAVDCAPGDQVMITQIFSKAYPTIVTDVRTGDIADCARKMAQDYIDSSPPGWLDLVCIHYGSAVDNNFDDPILMTEPLKNPVLTIGECSWRR